MVEIGLMDAGSIPAVLFNAPVNKHIRVEVLSLAELRSRAGDSIPSRHQRATFHHLLTLERGQLRHTVDFTTFLLKPGTWLSLRPGQVYRWHDLRQVEGTLILFEPDVLDPTTSETAALSSPHAPTIRSPTGEELRALMLATRHLQQEFEDAHCVAPDVHVAVLRHLLAVLILRLVHAGGGVGAPTGTLPEAFLQFRAAVEDNFTRTRRVEDYARQLGYSPRTLSRASIAAVGDGAKDFIDRRVILEAKRLLAHSDRTAAQIAVQLGFDSPTNFSKFFHRRAGSSPIAFRAYVHGELQRS